MLEGRVPPADFSEAGAPSPPADSALGLLLGALPGGSLSGAVGRILGGSGGVAAERWQHLAGDAAACEAIKTSVALHHIMYKVEMIEDNRERARAANQFYGGRLCTPPGSKALLVHGTPRWTACVRFAQRLAQRDGESDAAYTARCRRTDSWAGGTGAFEKAGVTLLVGTPSPDQCMAGGPPKAAHNVLPCLHDVLWNETTARRGRLGSVDGITRNGAPACSRPPRSRMRARCRAMLEHREAWPANSRRT